MVGLAVDIGTTTVAASSVDMTGCRRLGFASVQNPQSRWGSDVLSRISAAGHHSVVPMRDAIRCCIDKLRCILSVSEVAPTVIVGNTVMLSLWAGIDPTPIGQAPFNPPELFGGMFDGSYLPRCISAFVGADAVASAITAGEPENNCIMVDIGTNGEVILCIGGSISACAAAAGPALEGAGIYCGMTANRGAIDEVTISAGEISYNVIGDGKPLGICGSGLVDAVACLLDLGIIDKTGHMENNYYFANNVFLTPDDIRSFQLAKGAIRAAVESAVNRTDYLPFGLPIVLSGMFGSNLSARSCRRVGLLPQHFTDIRSIGNGALRGAELILCSDSYRDRADKLARNAEYIPLSGDAEFCRLFMEHMNF